MLLIDIASLKSLNGLFWQIIQENLGTEALSWLQNKADLIKTEEKSTQLNLSFSHLPRLSGKNTITITPAEETAVATLIPGFSLNEWTADRLCRVWLLMQVPADNPEIYSKKINGLFAASEMNEQVALYSALPFLMYPENWIAKCEEGIRSNIGTVLEAIMYQNPYPAKFLAQSSFNQLVLKAFFTEKDIKKISGLQDRLNQTLAETLKDYTEERLAAHRTVEPAIYELIELTNQKS